MSDDDNNKKNIDDLIKEKELERFNAEIARIEEERRKLELERKELERKSHLHWYKKPLFIQAIIAGIVAVPLIWFYVKDVALPLSRRENIKLSRELIKEKANLDEMIVQHEIKVGSYIENLKTLETDYDKVNSINKELVTKYEELSKENDKYADEINELVAQKVEIESKRSAVSESIKQEVQLSKVRQSDGYFTGAIAKRLFLEKDLKPRSYTENKFKIKIVDGDKVVVDHATGLMWQQSGSDDKERFFDLEKYIEHLNRDKFAGYNDWRLPTLEEAITLLEEETNNNGLYINPVFDKIQNYIWTFEKSNLSHTWVVYFGGGYCYELDIRSYNCYVRAVR